ncbi:hypothetical protein MVES1_002254 [Malassezia vespertilionis]|uniref:uncharacterized protein n=1 Tax=Malassezia vespertilionis TaxID=2020962 RepID=UPI0024B08F6F|nr:uncharacterized protein MVES1_002254 [Malassezia vespertilionis]WFD06899.1 hypothetical protein MVES1_002254 [Malassezia vespertilionis]
MTTKSAPLTCPGHTRPVVHLEHSERQHDGTYLLLSSCKDSNPMLRDWLGDWMGTFLGHKGAVWSAKLTGGDAARAVTGSADFSAKVWDTYTGEAVHTFSHEHIVRSVAVNASGSTLLTGGHEKKLRLFDLNKPAASAQDAQLFKPFSARADGTTHDGKIRSVVLGRGANGAQNMVVTAADDCHIQWWDLRTLAPVHELVLDQPFVSMDRCAGTFSELITVTTGSDALFFDLATHEVVKKHTLDIAPSSVYLHPTKADRFVAGCINDEWVRVYDYGTGECMELNKGHHGPVHCVSYTPDGEVAASGSEDGTVRLWQVNPGKKYGLWS